MLFQHSVWAVNSFGHTFGYENYNMGNNSKNNVFLPRSPSATATTTTITAIRAPPSTACARTNWTFNGIIITWLGKLGLARKIIFADRYMDEERPRSVD
jgi:hypothetical protein